MQTSIDEATTGRRNSAVSRAVSKLTGGKFGEGKHRAKAKKLIRRVSKGLLTPLSPNGDNDSDNDTARRSQPSSTEPSPRSAAEPAFLFPPPDDDPSIATTTASSTLSTSALSHLDLDARKMRLQEKLSKANNALRVLKNQHSALKSKGRLDEAKAVAEKHKALLPKKRKLLARIRACRAGNVVVTDVASDSTDTDTPSAAASAPPPSPGGSSSFVASSASQLARGLGAQRSSSSSSSASIATRPAASARGGVQGIGRTERRATVKSKSIDLRKRMQVKALAAKLVREPNAAGGAVAAASAAGTAAKAKEEVRPEQHDAVKMRSRIRAARLKGKNAAHAVSGSELLLETRKAEIREELLPMIQAERARKAAAKVAARAAVAGAVGTVPGNESVVRSVDLNDEQLSGLGIDVDHSTTSTSGESDGGGDDAWLLAGSEVIAPEVAEVLAQLSQRRLIIDEALTVASAERTHIDAQVDVAMQALLRTARRWRSAVSMREGRLTLLAAQAQAAEDGLRRGGEPSLALDRLRRGVVAMASPIVADRVPLQERDVTLTLVFPSSL